MSPRSWHYVKVSVFTFVDEYPEDNLSIRYYLCELVMPDADVSVTIRCTPGTSTSAAQSRMNADFK